MRLITKRDPPREIVPYRHDLETPFEDFSEKGALREALAREQGYLCCYCMRRIDVDVGKMKIEHWAPQSASSERRYDWTNLLGACMGGEHGDAAHQTCDTRKAAETITVNPTDAATLARVRFARDGRIGSLDAAIARDLNETLNLNDEFLLRARDQTLTAVLQEMEKRNRGSWTKESVLRAIARYRPRADGQRLPEFCEFIAQYFATHRALKST